MLAINCTEGVISAKLSQDFDSEIRHLFCIIDSTKMATQGNFQSALQVIEEEPKSRSPQLLESLQEKCELLGKHEYAHVNRSLEIGELSKRNSELTKRLKHLSQQVNKTLLKARIKLPPAHKPPNPAGASAPNT